MSASSAFTRPTHCSAPLRSDLASPLSTEPPRTCSKMAWTGDSTAAVTIVVAGARRAAGARTFSGGDVNAAVRAPRASASMLERVVMLSLEIDEL